MPKPYQSLDTQQALEYFEDENSVRELLLTLKACLQSDLPALDKALNTKDAAATQSLLHQIKGFAPIFCRPALTQEVAAVEAVSKTHDLAAVKAAYASLGPKLRQLEQEVHEELAS